MAEALKSSVKNRTPSEDYSITYIDSSNIIGKNIDLIGVGDYIKISDRRLGILNNANNEIQVSAISRNLKDSSSIQLTVEQTRRIDSIVEKMIARLL